MLGRFSGLEEDLLASVRRSVAVAAFISLFVATAVGLLLLRLITAPFGRLIRATQVISSGDLTQPVAIGTQDEIGELSRVLDDLRMSLARSEEVRRHMLADIAHELRNPLAFLRAKVEAMLDGIQPASEENLGSLSEKLYHLSHLVDELQDIALAEANELPLDVDTLDLVELLHNVEEDVRTLLAEDRKEFRLEVPSLLPRIRADRRRLLQVLWNLLSNAIRHTTAGDVVTIQVESHPEEVLIHVIDTGEGMDEETLAHVFDRFYRGGRKRASESLGLGLAITKEIVRAHGGRIWVESRPSEGTRFSFTLEPVA
jgi:signal transduction histidine kinase